MRRLLAVAAVGLGALCSTSGTAHAGGTTLDFEREWYAVGEVARASDTVSPTNASERGWIEHGPYFAHLVPVPLRDLLTMEGHGDVSSLVAQGVPLGPLELGPPRPGYAGVGVTLEFAVPDLPVGEYAVVHCNDPCTLELGDLIGAHLRIADPAAPPPSSVPIPAPPIPPPPPPTTAPPATTATTTVVDAHEIADRSEPASDHRLRLALLTSILVGAAVVGLVAVRRTLTR